jgi:iron-sulfur cluster repair protein YtfE (RIC family)
LKWKDEHDKIRVALGSWQETLSNLGPHPRERRESRLEALRATTHSLKTSVMEHCLDEENVLFPALSTDKKSQIQVEEFHTAHERLAIDLGEFERQMTSYQLSGDPTVLLALSDRMIRELNQHLAAEESFFAQVYDSTGGSERSADLQVGTC